MFKGAYLIKKIYPPFYPMKIEISVSEECLCFSDYLSEILGLRYVPFRYYEPKSGQFPRNVFTRFKVNTVLYGTVL